MKKITLLFTVLLLTSVTISYAQSTEKFFNDANTFLKTYVSNGRVDYKAIVASPDGLNSLIKQAEDIRVSGTSSEYKAFWINAYNLTVIKGIVDNYPIKSPLDKKGFFDTTKHNIAGSNLTLNDIENNMLRAKFKDARLHFVLVCGAKGCPPIIAQAYKPSTLEKQIDKQASLALNNNNFIKPDGDKVQLSEIFKWYKEDFVREGNEIDFINTFREDKIADDATISYYSYDWRVNAK